MSCNPLGVGWYGGVGIYPKRPKLLFPNFMLFLFQKYSWYEGRGGGGVFSVAGDCNGKSK